MSNLINAQYMPQSLLQSPSAFTQYGWNSATQTFGELPQATSAVPTEASGAASAGVMGNLSIGLSIGQMVGSVYSAFASSSAQKYALKKQAQVMEDNRAIAQLGAESAFRAGEAQIAQLTHKAGQRKAAQRAGFAANGVAMTGGGSYAEVLASGDIMKAIDKDTAEMNALANAWGYKRQASQYGMSAMSASIKSNYSGAMGIGNATGSLIENGTAVAARWYKYYGEG